MGANIEVVDETTGLLASSQDEWVQALIYLIENPEIRNSMGKASRQRCIEYYLCVGFRDVFPLLVAMV